MTLQGTNTNEITFRFQDSKYFTTLFGTGWHPRTITLEITDGTNLLQLKNDDLFELKKALDTFLKKEAKINKEHP